LSSGTSQSGVPDEQSQPEGQEIAVGDGCSIDDEAGAGTLLDGCTVTIVTILDDGRTDVISVVILIMILGDADGTTVETGVTEVVFTLPPSSASHDAIAALISEATLSAAPALYSSMAS